MWWPDLNLFYIGCTLEHILQNNTIKRFLAIFWRLTFSGHILTRLGGSICQVTPKKLQEKQFLIFYEVHDQKSNM